MWNGTAEILKATPAAMKTMPKIRPMPAWPPAVAAAMPGKVTVPVKP